MIWIDDDSEWPPSIHGTRTEIYFNHAWGMQRKGDLCNGAPLHESIVPGWVRTQNAGLTTYSCGATDAAQELLP